MKRYYGRGGSAVPSGEIGNRRGYMWWYWWPRVRLCGWPFRWSWRMTHVDVFWLHWFYGFSFYWKLSHEHAQRAQERT